MRPTIRSSRSGGSGARRIGPGGIQPVPPWDPTALQVIENLSPGLRKRRDDMHERARTLSADAIALAGNLAAVKQALLKELETIARDSNSAPPVNGQPPLPPKQ